MRLIISASDDKVEAIRQLLEESYGEDPGVDISVGAEEPLPDDTPSGIPGGHTLGLRELDERPTPSRGLDPYAWNAA